MQWEAIWEPASLGLEISETLELLEAWQDPDLTTLVSPKFSPGIETLEHPVMVWVTCSAERSKKSPNKKTSFPHYIKLLVQRSKTGSKKKGKKNFVPIAFARQR